MSPAPLALAALLALAPGVARATTLYEDVQGFAWDIEDDGSGAVDNGTSDAYDHWPYLCVTTDTSPSADCSAADTYDANGVAGTLEVSGRQIAMEPDTLAGLTVSRKVYVPDTGAWGFARYLEVLTNPTADAITVKVRLGSVDPGSGTHDNDLGSDSNTVIVDSDDGSASPGPGALWWVSDDDGYSDPFIAHVVAAATAMVGVSQVGELSGDPAREFWEYGPITISPGETVIFMHFESQQDDESDATTVAGELVDIWTLTETTEGLTQSELEQIVNYAGIDDDEDGVDYWDDNCPFVANPNQDDTDGDTVGDACDVCAGGDDTIDTDSDDVPDDCDPCPLDNPDDTDGDGVCEGDDNCPSVDNPGQDDADADGFGDSCDVCAQGDDALDADGDGTPDACDACPNDATGDTDGDGVCDSDDNCPDDANAGQENDDGDAYGDACDICGLGDDDVDADGDGTPDACDDCPQDANDDSDGDGVCDSDDTCPGYDDTVDTDGDGVPDDCDPCPEDDPDDTDGDGICDSDDPCPEDPSGDSDGDGVCDSQDECPFGDDSQDADGDGISDWCDVCRDGDDNVDTDGDGIPDACDACPNDADPACVAPADGGEEGCGCDGSGTAGSATWALLLGLAALARRRG